MKDLLLAIGMLAVIIYLLPVMVMLLLWAAVYGVILIPLAGIAYLLYRWIKTKGWLKGLNEPIPSYAIPTAEKVARKAIMVKWQGKEVPLGIFIFSIILAIIMVPVALILIIFYIPPMWTVLYLGYAAGKKICKLSKGVA